MKKTLIYSLSLAIFLLVGCRDESLNPNKAWEPGVHALGSFVKVTNLSFLANIAAKKTDAEKATEQYLSLKKDYADYFGRTDQANQKIDFKIRWVSLDNQLTVSKIDIFVEMQESYTDPDGNPKVASLGNKVVKSISTVAANRQWNTFSITPDEIYNLFKDATVKYNKTTDVKVFENPARPRPAGARLQGSRTGATADIIKVTWALTTSTGLVFKTWNEDSICNDPTPPSEANANCRLSLDVR
ncbi:MAG: hypothetical protein EAZ44_10675 [Cytophagia bacterium]|nr:MAG: hypothetical protein EAZ44_10675 [Cytophagia bacterium]